MSKKLLILLLGAIGASSFSASAAPLTMQCAPPILSVPVDPANGTTRYTVACHSANPNAIGPAVTFSGELSAKGTPPYAVKAGYTINTQSEPARKLAQPGRVDQVATGQLNSSTASAATLAAQFAAQTVWDSASGALSIETSAGVWEVYSIDYSDATDEPGVVDAGTASTPYRNGRATMDVVLGAQHSRFSGKSSSTLPVINAELRLRAGRLELHMGETQVANQAAVQGALMQLDRQPKDITRAWALAARAQYLGLDAETRYAYQKVAAHHPDILDEFQAAVQRIKPYSISLTQ